jgi:hypothetical protein
MVEMPVISMAEMPVSRRSRCRYLDGRDTGDLDSRDAGISMAEMPVISMAEMPVPTPRCGGGNGVLRFAQNSTAYRLCIQAWSLRSKLHFQARNAGVKPKLRKPLP